MTMRYYCFDDSDYNDNTQAGNEQVGRKYEKQSGCSDATKVHNSKKCKDYQAERERIWQQSGYSRH